MPRPPAPESTEPGESDPFGRRKRSLEAPILTLAVVWCRQEPHRVGEVLLFPPRTDAAPRIFGRVDGLDVHGRVSFVAQRPGVNEARGLPTSRKISRRQLELTLSGPHATPNLSLSPDLPLTLEAVGRTLEVQNVGQCRLLHNGQETETAIVRPGDLLELHNQLLLLCLERPAKLPAWPAGLEYPDFPFGEADAFGIVGESPAAWAHRLRIAVNARLEGHTLILGPTGAGKESTSRAVHALSTRRRGPFISCDFKAIPENFVSYELYGNRKSVPAGAEASEGLVRRADRGVLFLDEFGDISPSPARDLRRFLEVGEYKPLGARKSETADVRVLGATNRAPDHLPPDVAARFPLRIEVPPLSARIEDIPLIARHLLREMARTSPLVSRRFCDGDDLAAPRLAPALVQALLGCARDPLNVRAAIHLLKRSIEESLKVPDLEYLYPPEEDTGRSIEPRDLGPRLSPKPAATLPTDSAPATPALTGTLEPQHALDGSKRAFDMSMTDQERRRLALFRRHAFHVADFCAEAGLARGTANDRLNELLFKGLVAGKLSLEIAARLVAGDSAHKATKLQRRLEAAVDRLRLELHDGGEAALRARVRVRHRSAAPWVEQVIDALRAGKL